MSRPACALAGVLCFLCRASAGSCSLADGVSLIQDRARVLAQRQEPGAGGTVAADSAAKTQEPGAGAADGAAKMATGSDPKKDIADEVQKVADQIDKERAKVQQAVNDTVKNVTEDAMHDKTQIAVQAMVASVHLSLKEILDDIDVQDKMIRTATETFTTEVRAKPDLMTFVKAASHPLDTLTKSIPLILAAMNKSRSDIVGTLRSGTFKVFADGLDVDFKDAMVPMNETLATVAKVRGGLTDITVVAKQTGGTVSKRIVEDLHDIKNELNAQLEEVDTKTGDKITGAIDDLVEKLHTAVEKTISPDHLFHVNASLATLPPAVRHLVDELTEPLLDIDASFIETIGMLSNARAMAGLGLFVSALALGTSLLTI